MSSSQEDFEEDKVEIVRESLSDMDPALLFAANHFVEDLLAKAQEEANRRQTSETEVSLCKSCAWWLTWVLANKMILGSATTAKSLF